MSERLIDVNLICDNLTMSALRTELSASGGLLICNICRDVEAPIAGILVIDEDEEAWPLCGACLRRLPLAGAVA